MSEPRAVDPARKIGQDGSTWGNLLVNDGEMERDDEFVFESEPGGRHFRVKRLLVYPLDSSKRLAYYEAYPRRQSGPSASGTPAAG
jgi:hypothetical protein